MSHIMKLMMKNGIRRNADFVKNVPRNDGALTGGVLCQLSYGCTLFVSLRSENFNLRRYGVQDSQNPFVTACVLQ